MCYHRPVILPFPSHGNPLATLDQLTPKYLSSFFSAHLSLKNARSICSLYLALAPRSSTALETSVHGNDWRDPRCTEFVGAASVVLSLCLPFPGGTFALK